MQIFPPIQTISQNIDSGHVKKENQPFLLYTVRRFYGLEINKNYPHYNPRICELMVGYGTPPKFGFFHRFESIGVLPKSDLPALAVTCYKVALSVNDLPGIIDELESTVSKWTGCGQFGNFIVLSLCLFWLLSDCTNICRQQNVLYNHKKCLASTLV